MEVRPTPTTGQCQGTSVNRMTVGPRIGYEPGLRDRLIFDLGLGGGSVGRRSGRQSKVFRDLATPYLGMLKAHGMTYSTHV